MEPISEFDERWVCAIAFQNTADDPRTVTISDGSAVLASFALHPGRELRIGWPTPKLEYPIPLLEDVISAIVEANGDRNTIGRIVHKLVTDRAGVMHERAQRAEGRAAKAEAVLARVTEHVGRLPL